MDYVKLARTFIDDLLDRVEEEVDKLLQEQEEKPETPSPKPDNFKWYNIDVRVKEVPDSLYGSRYLLVTNTGETIDSSYSKSQLLARWGLE